ncbi:uncharacterized protein LOC129370826 [Poeciliopsis prolifica]|uniref:uncharacterized protein LOC129370826 n=1 Tax=Poeciliopsis prolifica TaxID=188132 RepID=UPI0024133E45|nr:uncharacterized protein LOC129370826 [Poeciliopsis prolifica]XP_054903009.1 uncharacterized protein LOC129370826 [Poeciliopsis prolifica]
MALTCEESQPESGKGLHTQESGDAGFSANMKHVFSDNDDVIFAGCGLPNANKNSSVRPMFIEAEISELTKKEMPVMFEPNNLVSTGKELGEARKRKQSSRDLKEQQFQEKMDGELKEVFLPWRPRQKAQKKLQKSHPRVLGRRINNCQNSKLKWKTLIVCCSMMTMQLVFCDTSTVGPTGTCFTCMDKARCPNLITIYAKNDRLVYDRPTEEEIPKCSEAPPITKNCFVCWSQSDVNIHCPNNITTFEAEDCNGSRITNIIKGCEKQLKPYPAPTGPANKASHTHFLTGLICSVVAVVMLL